MKSFLEYVAEDMISKYGTNLAHTVVVFPNKRASLFLNDHLARLVGGKPLWSPSYITISDLFRQHSQLQVADPIKLVCELHRSYRLMTNSDETLDKFYSWGQLLISDFDDIDKNMANADRVFANLKDIHELDDISYLSDEQRRLLQRFFSHFTEEHETELKQRFLRLWSHLAEIYHDFNERLRSQGLAYEGALYREVVEAFNRESKVMLPDSHESSTNTRRFFPAERYLFVGFNMVQKVEQRLFAELQRTERAFFYWDFDRYYIEHHEAGHYISQYLRVFPNELESNADEIYENFNKPKKLSYISAPTENIQAHYVTSWLREHARYRDGRRTAIVLCNESLLPTVIHCLPDEVDKVNITTGYPLSQTPISSFVQLYFNMLEGGHSPRLIRAFKRHPYARFIEDIPEAVLPNKQSGSSKQFDTGNLSCLSELLRQIARKGGNEIKDPLFQESVFHAYTLVNRLCALIDCGDLQVNDITLQSLVGQLLQQVSIPFHGEPAEGVQVMGVLETRNLDFDHVLLPSCNEGNMPRGVNDSSFIPHAIRHAYELTTVDNKVAIYAYYFHRLLQRAGDVTILYNNATEDGQRGEMSRFMLQLMAESRHSIGHYSLQAGKTVGRWLPTPISKTMHIVDLLLQQFGELLTPTAINKYMRCQLQFYYRYVAGIKEPDIPDDEQELDNRVFGNVFHAAAERIYRQLPDYVTKDQLDHLLNTRVEIERAVDEAFHQEVPHMPTSGLHLINREVIIHYLLQLISIDRQLTPFTILGLELQVERPIILQLPTFGERTLFLGGRIDRLDQLNDGRIRVIDYKTGSRELKALNDVEAIFDTSMLHQHSDYYLQAFIYADVVRRQQSTSVSPCLLNIQHAGQEGYDPTLRFGKDRIFDVGDYSKRFNELLEQKINEVFSLDTPFIPTADVTVCATCPYQKMCRRAISRSPQY